MRTQSNRLWGIVVASCGIVSCAGCSPEIVEVPGPGNGVAQAQGGSAPPLPAAPVPGGGVAAPVAVNQGSAPPAPAAAQPAARLPNVPAVLASDPDEKGPDALGAVAPNPNQEEAVQGVGAKGRGYGGGIVTEPIRMKFAMEQRLIFQVQIPEAMKLYKANHDNQAPQSHDAFMKEIVAANSIVLPQLPEGDKYLYDPKLEKLMVLHPSE